MSLPIPRTVPLLMGFDRAVYMLATLRVIREQFGSVENYVIEHCGLTKKDIENIRFNLVVREPALDQTIKHIL